MSKVSGGNTVSFVQLPVQLSHVKRRVDGMERCAGEQLATVQWELGGLGQCCFAWLVHPSELDGAHLETSELDAAHFSSSELDVMQRSVGA